MVTALLIAWFPAIIYLFTRFPPQRAFVISFITAWLFLPLASYKMSGIPVEYTKMSATCFGVLLATLLYDFNRFKSFQFHWFDLPVTIWCLCPLASSTSNDLGLYDGLSSSLTHIVEWGVPYYLGRIYLNSFAGLRQLATGIFVGGLLYIPFCLFEVIAHVNLHGLIYRFTVLQQTAMFSIRYGGYRPAVFLVSGLMLGTWMMFATLMGIALWRTKVIKRIRGVPISQLVVAVLITFILVKATGAYGLLVFGLIILWTAERYGTSIFLWLLLGGMLVYLYLGVAGEFPGQQLINVLEQFIDPERLQSLGFRFMNEEVLSAKAREKLFLGWGGFGRSQIFNAEGYIITTTDSLWIIALGQHGLVGLISVFTTLLLPPVGFWLLYPPKTWSHPSIVVTAAIAAGLMLYALDCVLNAMVDPIFTLAGGGLTGLILNQQQQGLELRKPAMRHAIAEPVSRN